MKKFLLTSAVFVFVMLALGKASAQVTEPGVGLPLLDGETATADPDVTATGTAVTTYATATPIYSTLSTATSSSQEAIDDAETGSEVIVLAILSITGGVGIFLIKKYFDFKRYSI